MFTFSFRTIVALGVAVLIGAAGGYFYTEHESGHFMLQSFYLHSSSAARIDVAVLTELRSGDTEKAIKLMNGLLEGELISLNSYEENTPPSQRSAAIYKNVAAVRAYYDRFPDIERPAYGKKGLALTQP